MPAAEAHTTGVALPIGRSERFLVAHVPRGGPGPGTRWQQIHFNKEVIDRFFQVQHDTSQRVYLVECRPDGTFGEQEVRPCVYSQANKNLKISMASHRGAPYPDVAPPIAVYRELHARSFAYMLLMPDDQGYDAMARLTQNLEAVGRGLRRVITDAAAVRTAWPECPLVTAIDAVPEAEG